MYTPFIAQLLYEHIRLRRILRILAQQLDRASRCEEADLGLLKRALGYLSGPSMRLHHSREDLLLERLAVRAPELSAELGILRLQHQELSQLEGWLLELVDTARRDGQAAYPRLIYFGRQYLRTQNGHSGTEEKTIFPRALQALGAGDWALLDGPRMADAGAPLDAEMRREVLAIYRHLMDQAKLAA